MGHSLGHHPGSVGFQPRTTPAERRADLDLRRLVAAHHAETEDQVVAIEADIDALDTRLDTAEADIVRLETAVCQVSMTAAQNVANAGAAVILDFDQEDYDPLGWHSTTTNPSRVTPNLLGLYQVFAFGEWAADSDSTRRLFELYRNGATAAADPNLRQEVNIGGSISVPTQIASPLILKTGTTDYFSIRVFQTNTSTGTQTIRARMYVKLVVPL